MIDTSSLSDLIKQAAAMLPDSATNLRQDFERNLRPIIEKKLNELNLVTREEFDQHLAKLEVLEAQMTQLEAELKTLKNTMEE